MTYDEFLDTLPTGVAKAIEDIAERAGTSDADSAVLQAAGEMVAELRTKNEGLIYREADIRLWAAVRNLIGPEGKATAEGQARKTLEEARELYNGIVANDRAEIIDALGDVYVTLVIQAAIQGVTMAECIDHAYAVISKRTGRVSNGVFVKNEG